MTQFEKQNEKRPRKISLQTKTSVSDLQFWQESSLEHYEYSSTSAIPVLNRSCLKAQQRRVAT